MPKKVISKSSTKKPTAKKQVAKKAAVNKAIAKLVKSTACLEGYKPSKSGSCIKDRSYVKEKVVRSTVCLEGYKISKAGRCVKDKNYKVVMATVPSVPGAPAFIPSAPAPPPLAPKGPRMTPIYLKDSNTVSFGIADKKAKDLLEKQRKPANFAEAIAMEAAKKREAAKAPAPAAPSSGLAAMLGF